MDLVDELFERFEGARLSPTKAAGKAGYSKDSLFSWRHHRNPHLSAFRDLVEAAGGRLTIEWGEPPADLRRSPRGIPGRLQPKDIDKVLDLRARGVSMRDIGAYFGVSHMRVSQYLTQYRHGRGAFATSP